MSCVQAYSDMDQKEFADVVEQVAEGITRLAEPLADRLLNCFLIDDQGQQVLFDAGLPGSVTRRLDSGQIDGPISQLIVSHADADHLGDAAALKRRFPEMQIGCHAFDQQRCEDHDLLVHERYDHARNRFDYGYGDETLAALREACGDDFVVDRTLCEDQLLRFGDREWCVLHLPGHSPGHVALWHEAQGILLGGDVVLGLGPGNASGCPAMPGTHEDIPAYLATIDRLEKLDVELALLGHWPPLDRSGFQELLEQSRTHVERDVDAIRTALRKGGVWTFAALMDLLNDRFSSWDADSAQHYSYALAGYLHFLVSRGELSITDQGLITITT